MTPGGMRIAIACEDQAHRALATSLADRVVLKEAERLHAADWVYEESLTWLRFFCGLHEDDHLPEHLRFYALSNASDDAKRLGERVSIGGRPIKLRGHIGGESLKPEAGLWRRLFILFSVEQPPPSVLIIVRDTDGIPARLDGLDQALALMKELELPLPIVVAAPNQDAEAWFVAGFVPEDSAEEQRLRALKEMLSWSPPDEPHKLTAHPNTATTDAKRVLRILVWNQNESRPPSLDELPGLCDRTLRDLDLLERRGTECGLNKFVSELRSTLVPILIPGATRR